MISLSWRSLKGCPWFLANVTNSLLALRISSGEVFTQTKVCALQFGCLRKHKFPILIRVEFYNNRPTRSDVVSVVTNSMGTFDSGRFYSNTKPFFTKVDDVLFRLLPRFIPAISNIKEQQIISSGMTLEHGAPLCYLFECRTVSRGDL